MSKLYEWATRWKMPEEAVEDLLRIFGLIPPVENLKVINSSSEAAVQNIVKLEASRKGARLWRNNLGAVKTEDGFIRYGLANESNSINQIIKSADLIGIKPVLITQNMIGKTIGQFLSREIKPAGWVFQGTEREHAQFNWVQLITSLGGDACFATGEGTI